MAINYQLANTFTPNTVISSAEVNQNFSDNANTWTGVEAMTKTFSHIKMDADPGTNFEVATKQYVDNSVVASLLGNSKNRVLNGEMLFDQNKEGGSYSTSVKQAIYTLDQWRVESSGVPDVSISRSTEAAPNAFFPTVMKIQTSLAGSPAHNDGCNLEYPMEPFYMRDFGWGTASAKTITLSFWALSSNSGTYSISFLNGIDSRSYVSTYTLVTNIWSYVTITVPGDTTGPVTNWPTSGNVFGLKIVWDLGSGSDVTTSALNSWQAGALWKATGSSNLVSTLNAVLYLTGVQLEIGSSATAFEFSPYPDMLLKLQRYYVKSFPVGTAVAQGGGPAGTIVYFVHNTGVNPDGVYVPFPVTMSTTPTITTFNLSSSNSKWYNQSAATDSGAATAGNIGTGGFTLINAQASGDGTIGQTLAIHYTANSRAGGS